MLYLYPANKMENLLALLSKIQQVAPLSIFAKEVIVVQNAGMQHWLNLSLAEARGISMNIDYALPAQFLWKLMRSLASEECIPDQSPFEREALSWRIYELLTHDNVLYDPDFSSVTQYWLADKTLSQPLIISEQQAGKRYQLACQLADLYEQYLVFRPEWISAWSSDKYVENKEDVYFKQTQRWQKKLWQLLTHEIAYSPISMLESAIKNLPVKQAQLPERMSFFGINAMAPMWLKFIEALSKFTQVHFFHLNPCFDYWGDIRTEKHAIKTLTKWTNDFNDVSNVIGNPLLANLGQQGREFLALLQDISTIDINAFDNIELNINKQALDSEKCNILSLVQQDILQMLDARTHPQTVIDDSIVITSAHSALREVQGLHDWLLHQFNADPTLTPKDILVMCPAVEDYAPYVNAVFAPGWQDIGENIPPLPCSIADRVSKDAEPIVATFVELLQLNTSRFEITRILSWLRLPSIRSKFSLENDDLDTLALWLSKANIHWGLDQEHKRGILGNENASAQFTWHYGLQKLVLGLAQSDQDLVMDEQLFLADVEGTQTALLGHLLLVVESLQLFAEALHQERTPSQWHVFLNQFIDGFFTVNDDQGFTTLFNAINDLVEYTEHASFTDKVPLSVVQDFLNNHFSQPDPGRHFMVGQVTFCSMLPMRSIPFKVVAVLGLNEGEYPRQRQPLGFDLMAMSSTQLGDRSRRGDDRYLFLEAIISARKALYLSYQGKSINNNNPREPSIVLKELMEYLMLGYGWCFNNTNSELRQLPMQPFSQSNYVGQWPSFDSKWLSLIKKTSEKPILPAVDIDIPNPMTLSVDELVRFFQHPSKWFANKQLRLFLDTKETPIDDNEPFVEDSLGSYLFRQALFDIFNQSDIGELEKQSSIERLVTKARISGDFPDLPTTEGILRKWQKDTEMHWNLVRTSLDHNIENSVLTVTADINILNQSVTASINAKIDFSGDKAVCFRMSSPKASDFLRLYIQQLVIQCANEQNGNSVIWLNSEDSHEVDKIKPLRSSHGFYFDTKSQKSSHYFYQKIDNAPEKLNLLLSFFVQGQRQPLLINSALAEKVLSAKSFSQEDFEQYWHDSNAFFPLGSDPYVQYFWPECPSLPLLISDLEECYGDCIRIRERIKL